LIKPWLQGQIKDELPQKKHSNRNKLRDLSELGDLSIQKEN
jgi:hypothetical protein